MLLGLSIVYSFSIAKWYPIVCEGTLKNLLFLAKYIQAGGGVCFSLGSCRGRVLDTMQVEVIYCRGGPGGWGWGGQWDREERQLVWSVLSKWPQWATRTQSCWGPLGSSIECRPQYCPNEGWGSWGICPPPPSLTGWWPLMEGIIFQAFLVWLHRSLWASPKARESWQMNADSDLWNLAQGMMTKSERKGWDIDRPSECMHSSWTVSS